MERKDDQVVQRDVDARKTASDAERVQAEKGEHEPIDQRDIVDLSSIESFPASDAPSWIPVSALP